MTKVRISKEWEVEVPSDYRFHQDDREEFSQQVQEWQADPEVDTQTFTEFVLIYTAQIILDRSFDGDNEELVTEIDADSWFV